MNKEAFVMILAGAVLFAPESSGAQEQLFKDQKCTKCHSISALDIPASGGEQEEEEGGTQPPDLSDVGKNHDAAFLQQYLKKETRHKPHPGLENEKKHPTKFKGSDAELKGLADWLAGLKQEPKK